MIFQKIKDSDLLEIWQEHFQALHWEIADGIHFTNPACSPTTKRSRNVRNEDLLIYSVHDRDNHQSCSVSSPNPPRKDAKHVLLRLGILQLGTDAGRHDEAIWVHNAVGVVQAPG